MIWITIVIVVIIIWAVSAASRANAPQRQLAALREWLNNYAESDYNKVQSKLRKDFQTPYEKKEHWLYANVRDYNERRNRDRVEFKENELWKRHVLTIMSSDKYSLEAKQNAANAWHDYITMTERLNNAIEIGYLDSGGMEELGKSVYESRNTLIGVMAAFDFDLEEETKSLEKDVAEKFPVHSQKNSKRTVV